MTPNPQTAHTITGSLQLPSGMNAIVLSTNSGVDYIQCNQGNIDEFCTQRAVSICYSELQA